MNALALFGALNAEDVIKIVVVVVAVFFSLIGKIIANMRAPKRPGIPPVQGPRPPALPPQQPRPAPRPQAQTAGPKTVKEEIDEFLRRAAQKKQSQSAPADPVRRISQPTATLAQRAEPLQAEVIRERPVGGAVSAHVKKYLDEKEFDERASKLGGDVAAADTKIKRHLKEVFGHGISKLAAKPGETAASPNIKPTDFFQDELPALPAAGAGLAALLNNIDNLRQAIVVNEILQRPIDRWK
ncbi:MAG: hypothetical protein ABSA26_06665 [Thermoguttaceae bacterium]|jgi:hypothetical protein